MSRISVFSEPLRLGNQRSLRINRHVKFTSPGIVETLRSRNASQKMGQRIPSNSPISAKVGGTLNFPPIIEVVDRKG